MKLSTLISSSFLLKSIFALSLFILVFISIVSYKHTASLNKSSEALMHSYSVRGELDRLTLYLKDAETGQRGFIISRDSSFLEPFKSARGKVSKSLYILKKLAASDHQQQRNIDTLYDLISLRFSYLNRTLKESENVQTDDSLIMNSMTRGKEVMDRIRGHIDEMTNLEVINLKQKQNRLKNEISFTPLFTLLLLLFSLLVFIFAYLKLNSQVLNLKKSNDALLLNTESISHAEKIGKFSTWHWNLDRNEITFSENQSALLGLPESEEKLDMPTFMEYVHPEDRDIIVDVGVKVITERRPSSVLYRVIRADGELRYFNSIGRIFTSLNGTKTLIGINTDVTELHRKNLSLEERNLELEQINKELASFNHVASHDLQEPLRIIQTYISRIIDREQATLTEAGKEYFERIQVSAHRMQVLINDLLLFSRTNKAEKVMEAADLNELLENAEQELSAAIEEKNAVIESEHLPVLQVIPFQIQQLFINLLGNSLKYTRSGVTPHVRITCSLTTPVQHPVIKADPEKKFYHIAIADNGLGFEQQYAENIFILFKRLHQKNEYPGTGIGLSICKKIAENHSGFISAEGFPGTGAIFHFFLPA